MRQIGGEFVAVELAQASSRKMEPENRIDLPGIEAEAAL
jgi:hypothetical protein